MLTKNTYYLMSGFLRRMDGGTVITDGMVDVKGNVLSAESVGSLTKPMDMFGAMCYPRSNNLYGTDFGVFFGTGKTPARTTDYQMETPITDGTSLAVISHASAAVGIPCTFDTSCMRITNTYELTNNTDADIAISEIGLFGRFTSTKILLLDHTVLDEPIVVLAGQAVPVTYEIKFPYGI